jgi:S-adenosylmethionine decarboxylase
MDNLGRQLIIEAWGCNSKINELDAVRTAIIQAVDAVGATLLELFVHKFHPRGVTGFAVLAESHLSVHSWPEHSYLTADVFTCGNTTEPRAAIAVFMQSFEPEHMEVFELLRGIEPGCDRDRPVQLQRHETVTAEQPANLVKESGHRELA